MALTTILALKDHRTAIDVVVPPPNLTPIIATANHVGTFLTAVSTQADHQTALSGASVTQAADHQTILEAHVRFADAHSQDLLAGASLVGFDGASAGYAKVQGAADHGHDLLAPIRAVADHSQRVDHLRAIHGHSARIVLGTTASHATQLLWLLQIGRDHTATQPVRITRPHANTMPAMDTRPIAHRHAQHLLASTRYVRL